MAPKLSEQEIQHVSLVQMHRSIENGRVFAKRRWMLQRAPDSTPFYISDNPMVIVNHLEPRAFAIEHHGVDIYLPISRQLTLYFVSNMVSTALLAGLVPEARDQTEAMCSGNVDLLAPENVQHQNSLQVQQASRFIISANGDFQVVREMIRRNPGLKKPPGYKVT